MRSKARFLGHPIHQMLIVLPLGLLIASVAFDVLYRITRNTLFPAIAFYNVVGGLIGGVVAAVFGLRDWLAIPARTRAKAVGAWHGGGNAVVMLLFTLSAVLRYNSANFIPGTAAFVLSLLGFGLAGVTGWLGGELVDRLGVGVEPGAHLNAPSSLSGKTATGQLESEEPEDVLLAVPVTGAYKNRDKQAQKTIQAAETLQPKRGITRPEDLE